MIALSLILATLACLGFATVAEAATPRTRAGRAFGYVRVSTDKQAASPEAQRQAIEAAARNAGRTIDAWFQDAPVQNPDGSWNDAQSGKVPIAERKAGRELCARLAQGDLVVMAKVDRGFRKLSDLVVMLDRWERVGVSLLMGDFPMLTDLTNPFQKAFVQMVGIFAEIERKLIAQRTREALAVRKRNGHAHGPWAGYGFRWERRWDREQQRHVKVRVRDEDERQVMAQIVRWRLDGLGWDTITQRLADRGVGTAKGKPWSRARVIRGFKAELMHTGSGVTDWLRRSRRCPASPGGVVLMRGFPYSLGHPRVGGGLQARPGLKFLGLGLVELLRVPLHAREHPHPGQERGVKVALRPRLDVRFTNVAPQGSLWNILSSSCRARIVRCFPMVTPLPLTPDVRFVAATPGGPPALHLNRLVGTRGEPGQG
jgi:DNA invertase Pin-like site-specific DNA recombinase